MPKSQVIEEKYINGIKVDKENDNCFFNDETHTYYDKKTMRKCISVTQLISHYCTEFDENFWSAYKALEFICESDVWSIIRGRLLSTKRFTDVTLEYLEKTYHIDRNLFLIKQEEIKAEYKKKRDEACERGTKIHLGRELSMYGKKDFDFRPYGFKDLYGQFFCYQDHPIIELERGVYPEFLIYADFNGLLVSGQADLLICDGLDVYLGDYKGLSLDTPILTTTGWKTMENLNIGDFVFDKDGNETKVIHTSNFHRNPCFKITFDNNDTLIADMDHKWLINFRINKNKYKSKVMTTSEIKSWMDNHPRQSRFIPKIFNCGLLNTKDVDLPIDPYVLGVWLGDGSKSCGMITNCNNALWKEIETRGYIIGKDITPNKSPEFRTVFGLRTQLNKLGLLGKKFIPDIYYTASYKQRLDLLRGFMDTDGYYNKKRKRFVMATGQKWQAEAIASLVSTFGWKPTIIYAKKYCNNKIFDGYDVCFTTNNINPFLTRNQENIEYFSNNEWSFRNIVSIEEIETVTTKCIEVDSPTHTYLAGKNLITTHNTNREIKKTSYFDQRRKKYQMMKPPLNNIMDSTFNHYALQLSLYSRMLQQNDPKLNIKQLQIIHIDHDNNETIYEVPYLKSDVERMLKHYTKQQEIQEKLDRDRPVII